MDPAGILFPIAFLGIGISAAWAAVTSVRLVVRAFGGRPHDLVERIDALEDHIADLQDEMHRLRLRDGAFRD